jgi:hypothetical protein
MSKNLRHFFHQSLQFAGTLFTCPKLQVSTLACTSAPSVSTKIDGESSRHDPSATDSLLERINYRLNVIEDKIDQLLMPIDAVKH